MAERWHQETNNFHLHVGEMTITLDDHHDQGVDLMVTHILFPVEDAVEQASNNSGAFVIYTALKERYEHLLNRCNHLLGEDLSEEEEEELSHIRPACVKAFLLLLLGYTLFASKNNKTINLLWMLTIWDLDDIDTWSWGGMRLAVVMRWDETCFLV